MRGGRVRVRKELALIPIIYVNSFAVVLMLFSGFGISAISSVPYAFNQVLPDISLGTWTYLFQGLLVCILFGVRRNIHIPYLFSFVVGFLFGIAVTSTSPGSAFCRRLCPGEFCILPSATSCSAWESPSETRAGCPWRPRICFPGNFLF